MGANEINFNRRRFLQQTATLTLGALSGITLARTAHAASKDRVVIYQGVSLDSLHLYGYSGGAINSGKLPFYYAGQPHTRGGDENQRLRGLE